MRQTKKRNSPKPTLKPQTKESEISFMRNQISNLTIQREGGFKNVVRGSETHLSRIQQALQKKIEKEEVFLLPSIKRQVIKQKQ